MADAFPTGPGEWLRCQFHCHTTNSDGDATPTELCAHYAGLGFDVVAITDHWHVTEHEHPGLLTLPGSELSCRHPGPTGEVEALALGVASLPEPRERFADLETMAAWIAGQGGVPVLNHPYWSGISGADVLAAPSIAAIEVWNGSSEVMQGNGLSTVHWDDALTQGRMVWGIATDDCHSPGEDSGAGWTWVHVAERSAGAVLDALRRGASYGSAGPRIEAVEIGADSVDVRSSPVSSIRLRSGPWDGCAVNADPGRGNYKGRAVALDAAGLVTAARLDYPEYWRWARVEVEDEHGRRAWGNPFRLPGEEPASRPGAFDY